jgi:hypothetical protein
MEKASEVPTDDDQDEISGGGGSKDLDEDEQMVIYKTSACEVRPQPEVVQTERYPVSR